MNNYAIVIGIFGKALTSKEIIYLNKYKPLGVILFKRNIFNKSQVSKLIREIKNILGTAALIMIDQEGGRVSRLNPEFWPVFPAANYFGNIAKTKLDLAKKITYENYYAIGKELNNIGVNYNCAPVLDLLLINSNKVISDRAFSRDPKIITILGEEACKGLMKAKIFPVIKHIPGHGRAQEDSHQKLPEIDLNITELKDDFYPFKQLNQVKAAMTAHIKYKKIDSKHCATHSKKIIHNIIRKHLGYEGILFSDDLCMKALKGPYFYRAKKAIEAGCDIVLHCEPNLKYILQSTLGAGKITNKLKNKLSK